MIEEILSALEQNPLHFTVAQAQSLYERLQFEFYTPMWKVYICMMVRYLIAYFSKMVLYRGRLRHLFWTRDVYQRVFKTVAIVCNSESDKRLTPIC